VLPLLRPLTTGHRLQLTLALHQLMWNAYNEKVLIVLTVAAVISLGLGLYETLGVDHSPGSPPPVDWVEGMAICVAIIIVVVVGGLNDWQKERAFVRLNAKKDDRQVKVIRSGKSFMINVAEVLVGDVVHLEPGMVKNTPFGSFSLADGIPR
jgi:P-type Ca2+ transporter type 2C